jgi:formylglycine-generating enzyme required for sulfatase activity
MRYVILYISLFLLQVTVVSTFSAKAADKIYINSIGMEFVLIPSGSFIMGSLDNDLNAGNNEKPAHKVIISKPFYLGKYEVTQAQWEAVMGNNPSRFKGSNNPIERVIWEEIQAFIQRLNQKEGHDRYRLPTEAEWEYAARAGTTSMYSFGDNADSLGRYAWCGGNSGGVTHPVGQKESNAWGLYDMHGNVWEWVQDWYSDKYYSSSPPSDPRGPSSGSHRVERGGGWRGFTEDCRPAIRNHDTPDTRRIDIAGFRLALSPE